MAKTAFGKPRNSATTMRAGWNPSLKSFAALFGLVAVWASLGSSASAATPSGFMALGPHAVVRTRVLSGDPATSGSVLSVLVEVSRNTTPLLPAACAFRVRYRSDALQWVGLLGGDLGSPVFGPIEGVAPNLFRDVSTLSNTSNQELTPQCFTVRFRVINPLSPPYSISVSNDPASTGPLVAVDLATNIPHVFNSAATAKLGVPAGGGL